MGGLGIRLKKIEKKPPMGGQSTEWIKNLCIHTDRGREVTFLYYVMIIMIKTPFHFFLIQFDVRFMTVLAYTRSDSMSFTVHCLVVYHRRHRVWVREMGLLPKKTP
jgi:hypothetical protein